MIGAALLVHGLYLGDNRVEQINQMRIELMKSGVWYVLASLLVRGLLPKTLQGGSVTGSSRRARGLVGLWTPNCSFAGDLVHVVVPVTRLCMLR